MNLLIEIIKPPYTNSGVEDFDRVVSEWKGMILPIQEFDVIKEGVSVVINFKEEGVRREDYFLVRREDLENGARFQKRNGLEWIASRTPCNFFSFPPSCCRLFVNFEDTEFSEKDLKKFGKLKFRVLIDLDIDMLKEVYKENGYSVQDIGDGKYKVIPPVK